MRSRLDTRKIAFNPRTPQYSLATNDVRVMLSVRGLQRENDDEVIAIELGLLAVVTSERSHDETSAK